MVRLAKILRSKKHPAVRVDPFGARPCECDTVIVHTTDGDTLGEDMVECESCGWRMTLAELYKDHKPGSLVGPDASPPDGDDVP